MLGQGVASAADVLRSRSLGSPSHEHIAWLAENLDDPITDRLRRALTNGVRILGLDVDERESLLRAMTDPPDGLLELRATLLQEHVGRKRDELA